MSQTNNVKAVAEEYSHIIWGKKDLNAIENLVDPKIIIHSRLGDFKGANSLKKIIQSWLTGFPDLKVTNTGVVCENDRVFIQWKASGTHTGEFKGISPTHKQVNYEGVTIYRINMGKIVEYWAYLDMLDLLEQLR